MAIIRLSMQLKAEVVTLEARASNHSAQALYAKYGFKTVGIRRRYYTDNSEDAVIMTTDKINSPGYQAMLRELDAKIRGQPPGRGSGRQVAAASRRCPAASSELVGYAEAGPGVGPLDRLPVAADAAAAALQAALVAEGDLVLP